MPVWTNISGSWQQSNRQYANISGSWQQARRVWANVDGSWTVVSGQVVDDFEDGDRSGWTVPSSTGSDTVTSSGLDGSDFRWEHSGFREGHLAGADAVDRGPQPGDRFEFWFRIESTSSGGVINRFEFSADGNSDGDCYRIEWERETGDDEVSLEKISGGSGALLDTDPNFVPPAGSAFRCEVGWNDGDNAITAQFFNADGSTASSQLSISDDSSSAGSEYQQPGIAITNSGNNTCSYDQFRIID